MILMPFFLRPFRQFFIASLPLFFCGGALAFTALQFDATAPRSVSRTDGAVAAWVSTRGGVVANPCHATECGWVAPFYKGGESIDFIAASGVASPLSFALTETDAMAIRSYLSKKWRIGRYRSGTNDELALLRALGIRVGAVYGSMLIMM